MQIKHKKGSQPVGNSAVSSPSTQQATRSGRGLDMALMVLTLLPAAILVAVIAALNSVVIGTPRQAFFLQRRMGLQGRTFTLVKFRTLTETCDAEGKLLPDELRVTPFGRLLRNSHLDELPQLWNILRGDMSFLGPRPEMLSAYKWAVEEVPGFEQRLCVRPGITGLAQITQGYARQTTGEYERKLQVDLEYIRHKSLALDIRILMATAVWMLRGKGWNWKALQEAEEAVDATDTGVRSFQQAKAHADKKRA